MGFLTVVVLHNDALHTFEENPQEFAKAIFDGINKAQFEQKAISMPVGNYSNYLHVHPSRHADENFVLLHSGNTVVNLNAYREDFKSIVQNNPTYAQELLDRAKKCLKEAEQVLKRHITWSKK